MLEIKKRSFHAVKKRAIKIKSISGIERSVLLASNGSPGSNRQHNAKSIYSAAVLWVVPYTDVIRVIAVQRALRANPRIYMKE